MNRLCRFGIFIIVMYVIGTWVNSKYSWVNFKMERIAGMFASTQWTTYRGATP